MENRTIIIILVAVIIVLAAVLGILLLHPNAKEPCKILITSDKEQYEGGEISFIMADLNKTPISKEIVNVTITNSKGKVVYDQVVKTNSKGKAKLDLNLKKGIYKVVVAYGGNENYTGNNTTQKLTIKEAETVSTSSSSSSLPYSLYNLPPSNDPYPETSREQTDEYTVMQMYEDGYISYVDLRTGERSGGGYYKTPPWSK